MSLDPVSCLLIVVEAHNRISNVVDAILKYAAVLEPKEFNQIVVPCITHMDDVKWGEDEFRKELKQHTGIARVLFTQLDKTAKEMEDEILLVCHPTPIEIKINR